MMNASDVIADCGAGYAATYRDAHNASLEILDVLLEETKEVQAAEGIAAVADFIEESGGGLSAIDQMARVPVAGLVASMKGLDPDSSVLTKHAAADLMVNLLVPAIREARHDSVAIGRVLLSDLPVDQLAGAAMAISILEEHASAEITTIDISAVQHTVALRLALLGQPIAVANIARTSNFQQLEPDGGSLLADTSHPNDLETTPVLPHKADADSRLIDIGLSDDDVARLVDRAIHASAPEEFDQPAQIKEEMRLIAEFPAAFCPPMGRTLSHGIIGVVQRADGRREAAFRGSELNVLGEPFTSGMLAIPKGAKVRMSGRIDLLHGFYIIVGGGKSAARALLTALGKA